MISLIKWFVPKDNDDWYILPVFAPVKIGPRKALPGEEQLFRKKNSKIDNKILIIK